MSFVRYRPSLTAVTIVAALLLSACGTSGGNDGADKETTTTVASTDEATTTTTEAEPEPEPEPEGDADAQARAEAIDLTVSDFADGWRAEPATDDGQPSPLEGCDPSFSDDSDELATFTDDDFLTGDFDAGDGTSVAVETKVFTSEDDASAALAPFADPDVLACIDAAIIDQFGGNDTTTVEGEFGADEYLVTQADESVAASAEYVVTDESGEALPLSIGVLIIRTGDLATQVVVTSVGGNLDPTGFEGAITRIEELQAG